MNGQKAISFYGWTETTDVKCEGVLGTLAV